MASLSHGDPPTDLDGHLLAGLADLHAADLAAVHPVALIWLGPVHRWLLDNELCDFAMAVLEALTRLEAAGRVEQAAPGLYRLATGVRA